MILHRIYNILLTDSCLIYISSFNFRMTYKRNKLFAVITCAYLSTLYTHLSHLWSGYINYDYNMKFNVVIGNVISISFYSKICRYHNRN